MSEWICVLDKLPNKRGEYIAYTPKQEVIGYKMAERRVILRWNGTKWLSSFTVTHWMPLPEPPK